MFPHGSWDHFGNMLFLAIFGKAVEDCLGRSATCCSFRRRLVATFTQTAARCRHGHDARVPNLGASGAIAPCPGRSSSPPELSGSLASGIFQ
jgi:membrane associated rhomboid family serine protease